jgi:hypothetical protein
MSHSSRCFKVGRGMTPSSCYLRIAFLLVVPLSLAATLAAQQSEKQGAVSLTLEPARITINAGQTQKILAHVKGAPTATVIRWAVPDRERDVSSISQDGVFTARIVGVYHVMAIAIVGESTVLKTGVAKVTVLGRSEF